MKKGAKKLPLLNSKNELKHWFKQPYSQRAATLRRCIPAERRYPTGCGKDKAEKKAKSNI